METAPSTLDLLAQAEHRILAELDDAVGPPAQRLKALEKWGVFTRYREIHRDYAGLLADPASATEALKRAVFLQWLMFAEPAFLTGLSALLPGPSAAVLAELERRAAEDEVDDELAAMLGWYFVVADHAFPPEPELPRVHALAHVHARRAERLTGPFAGRGQMGQYWLALQRRHD